YEVAHILGVPLDVLIVRKLGVPGHPELAMGAIASGGASYFNKNVIQHENVSRGALDTTFNIESMELKRRERLYRGNRPPLKITERVAIIVDDGIATGATAYAAVKALRMKHPAQIVVAVPVAPRLAAGRMLSVADNFVAVQIPADFHSVGQFYEDFDQVSDDEVRTLLARMTWEQKASA
ncbi:MAG: phosphoribosyltransferase, partial [Gammaproteobacteria bacterium]